MSSRESAAPSTSEWSLKLASRPTLAASVATCRAESPSRCSLQRSTCAPLSSTISVTAFVSEARPSGET